MLDHLGAVQLDTISRARSVARAGRVRAARCDRPVALETAYWSDATQLRVLVACGVHRCPMESWPLFAFRRRCYVRRGHPLARRPAAGGRATCSARLADGPVDHGRHRRCQEGRRVVGLVGFEDRASSGCSTSARWSCTTSGSASASLRPRRTRGPADLHGGPLADAAGYAVLGRRRRRSGTDRRRVPALAAG